MKSNHAENNPVGIIDSGSGGLSIWSSIVEYMPNESTVYAGDHANMPYSNKTTLFIRERICKIIKFLLTKKIKLLVIACNTATVAGIDWYRQKFTKLPIIGVVPVIKTAAAISNKHCFAVLSTLYTAKSSYQKKLIKSYAADCQVYNLGCPNLVFFVEKGELNGERISEELRSILQDKIVKKIDVLALGCTHYPFLRESIRAIVGEKIQILDSGAAVARQTQRILIQNSAISLKQKPEYEFFTTGKIQQATHTAKKLLGRQIRVKYVRI